MEEIDNLGVPTAGATLDAMTFEAEVVGVVMIQENVEVLTIESSPEWRGALIEEEIEMAKEREDVET